MENRKELDVLSLSTTLGSLADAQRLGRLLLERRLAACVHIEPGLTSLYRWQGELCEDSEVRLTLKTLPSLAEAVEALLAEEHPYELPQVLACEMQASAAYAGWVRSSVTPG